jgi:anti-sigma B factor antagonist
MTMELRSPLLSVDKCGDATVVRFIVTRLEDGNIEAVGEQLFSLVRQERACRLRLDLEGVEYLTSTALGKLVGLHNRVRAAGGQLTLVNVAPTAYHIFRVTNLNRILTIQAGAGVG